MMCESTYQFLLLILLMLPAIAYKRCDEAPAALNYEVLSWRYHDFAAASLVVP